MTSKKHYGKQTGRSITHELLRPPVGYDWKPLSLDTGETRAEKAGHHAIGRTAGIRGRGQAGASGSSGSAGQRANAGTRTAHRWQRLLDEERAASVAEIAKAEVWT